jgi:TetR/AcrR family transcriptional repressor of nem operon
MKKSRKDEIINLANIIIRKSGYTNLSYIQISKEIGVSRENIHHYFPKKESLGLACIDSMSKELKSKFENIIRQDISAIDKLKEYFSIYKIQRDDIEDCPIASLLNEYTLLPKNMQIELKELCQIEIDSLKVILNEGKEKNLFKIETNIQFKAQTIVTLLKGAVGYTKVYKNFKNISDFIIEDLKK